MRQVASSPMDPSFPRRCAARLTGRSVTGQSSHPSRPGFADLNSEPGAQAGGIDGADRQS